MPRPDSRQAGAGGRPLQVRNAEVVQKEGEPCRGLLDGEVIQGDELPQEGRHRMAVPAPVDGKLGDGDGERTGVVSGLVRGVYGLPLAQVAERLVLAVALTGFLVKGVCQALRQGVDIIRALGRRVGRSDSFHVCKVFIRLDVPCWTWHLWVGECRSGSGTDQSEVKAREVLVGEVELQV